MNGVLTVLRICAGEMTVCVCCVIVCFVCVCMCESRMWREIGVNSGEGSQKRGGKEQWWCRVLNAKSVVH